MFEIPNYYFAICFKVKFYTAEPNNLKEELTRYFYFLQLRNDLRSGRLPCLQENLAVELCTLILQEELGKKPLLIIEIYKKLF